MYVPLDVLGDGNCLFRALSRNLYSTEEHHLHLRLLTAIEAALHPEFYNTQRDDYQDLVLDNRQVHDPYNLLMKSIARPGGFSELLVIFAASAALSIGIQSYCPPTPTLNSCLSLCPGRSTAAEYTRQKLLLLQLCGA